MRIALTLLLLAAAAAVVLVVGLGQRPQAAESPRALSVEEARERLAGAPPALAALHQQANELLPADRRALEARLEQLEGHPVVITKWAAWCGPCRVEAPFFNSQGVEQGRRVAFIGLDWRDSSADARDFLDEMPLPFPSYEDPEGRLARFLGMPENVPVTLFLDERGEVAYLHQGGYASEAALADDIERYLLPA